MTDYIVDLFPTPVSFYHLNREITSEEKETVLSFSNQSEKNVYNNISTDYDVLKHNNFKNLKSFFEEKLNHYMENVICPTHNLSLYITESWLNYTNKDEHHHQHHHYNSIISGVFYFNVIENDSISFYKRNYTNLEISCKKDNKYNSYTAIVPIKENQLILFPSNMPHAVSKNLYDKTRISLAFNTFFEGTVNTTNTIRLTL